jgi:hypothetical protein
MLFLKLINFYYSARNRFYKKKDTRQTVGQKDRQKQQKVKDEWKSCQEAENFSDIIRSSGAEEQH